MCFITLFFFFFFYPLFLSFFQVLLQILPCFSLWTKISQILARIYIPAASLNIRFTQCSIPGMRKLLFFCMQVKLEVPSSLGSNTILSPPPAHHTLGNTVLSPPPAHHQQNSPKETSPNPDDPLAGIINQTIFGGMIYYQSNIIRRYDLLSTKNYSEVLFYYQPNIIRGMFYNQPNNIRRYVLISTKQYSEV